MSQAVLGSSRLLRCSREPDGFGREWVSEHSGGSTFSVSLLFLPPRPIPGRPPAEEVDVMLQRCEGGVDAALQYAKTISKYMKDLIGYLEKRTTLGETGRTAGGSSPEGGLNSSEQHQNRSRFSTISEAEGVRHCEDSGELHS